jgi:putative effector of murein hydrolase LrgA (UPF0299 family)
MPIESSVDSLSPGSGAVDAAAPAQPVTHGGSEVARRIRDLSMWFEGKALFIVAVCAVVALSLAGIPAHLSQDGWLALVAGRLIAAHGVPHHDYFTTMAYGVHWVDQQWLAQLLMYELARIGGLQLLTVLYVLVTGAAFAGAIVAARNLGGQDLHVLAMLPAGAFFYLATAVSIRTQGFAYPLFVVTVWLLASEVRSPVRRARVYWVFPMLVLWSNLHGSVTVGAGLAVLYGLTVLFSGLRAQGVRGLANVRGLAFVLLSPLTLFATPYGTQIIHYYDVTLLNSQFGRLVTEWRPVSATPILAAPLFILMVTAAWVLMRVALRARSGRAKFTPLFDVLTLTVLAFGAVTAVRNITWFGLAVMILLPASWTQMKGGAAAPLRRARVNRILAIAMTAITALAVAIVIGQPASWFTSTYPSRAIPTLKRLIAKDPSVKIFADVRYADWLIWNDPRQFSGRVAYDTSFELLTPSQLSVISNPAAKPKHGDSPVARYGIWMLNPVNRKGNRALLKRSGVDTIIKNRKVIIATSPTYRQTT